MINPWYNVVNNVQPVQQQASGQPMFQNPMQKVQYILQAMRNPAAFVKQVFPDIPNEISNNPNQILAYLQQTRGISNEQIQQASNQIPR